MNDDALRADRALVAALANGNSSRRRGVTR